MSAAALIDRTAAGRMLVIGSLPPEGRDLDLLVRHEDEQLVSKVLLDAGYMARDGTWARFSECSADVVDVLPAASWSLGTPQLEALFDEAQPLVGFERLRVPAPHHELLIAATRFLGPGGRLPVGRASRLASGAATNPRAWSRARADAAAWRAQHALVRLEAALEGKPRRDPRATARAALRRVRPRVAVIALSGIDGSGKSTQARLLAESLDRLGYPAMIEWTPLAGNTSLGRIGGLAKRILGRIPSLQPETEPSREERERERGIVPNPGSELRRRSPSVSAGWATLVALANGLFHARRSARNLAAGRVVIFDRYVLDSYVRLRFLYGESSSFRLQRLLIAALSPKPRAAFYIEVDAGTSLSRKDDKWSAEELAAQARLYAQERELLGVRTLDGRRTVDDLAAEIAAEVWHRLD